MLPVGVVRTVGERQLSGALDKALPGWLVDKLTQGASSRNQRTVWGACVSIAMSAQVRGWREQEFTNAVAADQNKLWRQLNTQRDGRQRSSTIAYRDLHTAWLAAATNLADVGLRTSADLTKDAEELALMWSEAIDHPSIGLSPRDRAVMHHVVQQVQKRAMARVTCPRREVANLAGITEKAARCALDRLTARGFLIKVSAGESGDPTKGALKAAIYRLSTDVWGP
ncbi:hypothetical protein SRABI91_04942 [Rhodococcoides fascians]|nr:hypothetical protein SRABI91_04942 [Rhodococcus fascians]